MTTSGTVPALFEQHARRVPEAMALIGPHGAVTYGELNERANRCARVFVALSVGPESVVGLSCERSIDMVTALLAILKTGAAFLPLDPSYPAARLAHAVHDAKPAWVVTETASPGPWNDRDVMTLDDLLARSRACEASDLTDAERTYPLVPAHPAYVIFTSGSSGVPKGVVGLHEGIVNRAEWWHSISPMPTGPVLAKTSTSFIDGVTEILSPLLAGGSIVLAAADAAKDLGQLVELIRTHDVRQVTVVPSLLRALVDECGDAGVSGCRWISSGEPLPGALASRTADAWPDCTLLNLYGVSEVSGDSLWTVCQRSDTALAHTLPNTQALVLDENCEHVSTGVCGELYLGGVGLARGYVGRPALTAERFGPNPFGERGSRLYRTGDLARRREDGKLEIVGRADRQVKIAGVRVELGEIEAALGQLASVREAAVAVSEEQGTTRLIANVVPVHGRTVDAAALREELRALLPAQMIPQIVAVDALPRLPNGKLDRSALSSAVATAAPVPRLAAPEERLLCEVFAELFGRSDVGPDSDFLELGGQSLLAMRLVSRIRKKFGVDVPLRTVFQSPRIVDLARHLASAAGTEAING